MLQKNIAQRLDSDGNTLAGLKITLAPAALAIPAAAAASFLLKDAPRALPAKTSILGR
jgi:hypothetical protein